MTPESLGSVPLERAPTLDAETLAIATIAHVLQALDNDGKRRVMDWARDRFVIETTMLDTMAAVLEDMTKAKQTIRDLEGKLTQAIIGVPLHNDWCTGDLSHGNYCCDRRAGQLGAMSREPVVAPSAQEPDVGGGSERHPG